jgi:hypothetical protein
MIYEFRTYNLKPRTMAAYTKAFGEALPKRLEFSPLAAFWCSEIGPLNQVIHVWPYADVEERNRVRKEAAEAGVWPPQGGDVILDMRSEIFTSKTSFPALEPGDYGPYYEMRTYVLEPGSVGRMEKRWDEALGARTAISPLAGIFFSEFGALNQWVHIWPYKSLDDRAEARAEGKRQGVWPPAGESPVIAQESKILIPAPFSPMQ